MKKFSLSEDPFAGREAEKYPHPVPSREYILTVLEKTNRPLTAEKLIKLFQLTTEEEMLALRSRLRAMDRDGQLECNRRGAYGVLDKMNLVTGYIVGHKDGFGFLVPDEGGKDLYLSSYEMRQVFHGDRAVARVIGVDTRGRREGSIVRVLEYNTPQVVGRYQEEHGVGFVIPEHRNIQQDILIAKDNPVPAKPGQIVVTQIVQPPSRRMQAVGHIMEVLGDHMAPGMEIDISLRAYSLPHHWSSEVRSEIETIDKNISEAELKKREDLRKLAFVTIDGETARDFDDAVYCEPKSSGGFRLYVAIADVSHYVKPNTALDKEALNRGNSVYFPKRVIPMLPEILSNELCSLNPHVDRLAMVCEADIDETGKLGKTRFFEAVICSRARLVYTHVAQFIEGDRLALPNAVWPHIDALYALFKILNEAREERGAISFESQETEIIFGEGRKIKKIVPAKRNVAHQLIEECMLIANIATAQFAMKHKLPIPYRIHDKPTEEKLLNLRAFLGEVGVSLSGGESPKPKDFSKLLNAIKQRDDAHLIQTVMLRSMAQAQYSPENIGHFGLAFPAYTHFTSPIRRYPDLWVHRMIRSFLQKTEDYKAATGASLQPIAEHCSMTERRADEATRDVILWLKCEYMLDKVGEVFNGIISGVTSFGFFVELKEIYVEGLVHVSSLTNDYYQFDGRSHRLIGERTQKVYRLGDAVQVKVARVDLDERKIDLTLVGMTSDRKPKTTKTSAKSAKRKSKGKDKSRGKDKNKEKNKGKRKRK